MKYLAKFNESIDKEKFNKLKIQRKKDQLEYLKQKYKLIRDQFYSLCDKILIPEIKDISFILEDEGNQIFLNKGDNKPGLPFGLFLSLKISFGGLSNRRKREEYNTIYQEFLDRCKEICEKNNCYILTIDEFEKTDEFKFGYVFHILPNGFNLPKRKELISYRQLGL